MIKKTFLFFVLLLSVLVSLLFIPTAHVYILEKVTIHFLHVKSSFHLVEFNLNAYEVEALLDTTDTLSLSADYSDFKNFNATLSFKGNTNLFSKVAQIQLPKIKTELQATFEKTNVIEVRAKLLDGTLEGSFYLDTLSYKALAKQLSLQSYLTQQDMDSYADGELYLDSEGSFADLMDIKVELLTQDMHLLSPTLTFIPDQNSSSEPMSLRASLSLEDTKLNSKIDINSSLSDLKLSDIKYDLAQGDFELALDLDNKIKAYKALKTLHVKTSGNYTDANLTARMNVVANDYKLHVKRLDYIENQLYIDYMLYSDNQELVDISAKNPLSGEVVYRDDTLDANITSPLLEDDIDINFKDNFLHVSTKALSLAGILRHIRQEALATATLSLNADVNLSDALTWEALVDTKNISLSEALQKTLNNKDDIALHVSAYNSAENIIINPKISSSLLSLQESEIVFETLKNLLHVKADFKDINISYYNSPTLVLNSDINLSDILHLSTQISSDNEKIKLELSKKDTQIDIHSSFDFKNINRMPIAKDFNSISGEINATQIENKLSFQLLLKDINSSIYKASYAKIEGEILQEKLLHADIALKTPYEKLDLKLKHDENLSDMTFIYELSKLNRFAPLNPQYTLDGSGALLYADNNINLDINSTQFGPIRVDKKEDNISLHVSSLALMELFKLTNKEASLDGNIALDVKFNPSKLIALVDSDEIYSLDENATFRPTPLHVNIDLDGNQSHYQGEINLKMREESLTCKNFSFENSPLILKTDFSLASHNLENGALILPDILVGETSFNGDIVYDKNLLLHVRNDSLNLSEKFHKSIDKNATGNITIAMQSDVKYQDNNLSIAMYSQSQYYDLHTFNTQIDLNQSLLVSTMKVKSTLAREKADLHVKMQYTNPYSIDALIQTDYESVKFNNVRVNVDDLDVNGTYNITLLQTPKKGLFQHGVAKLKGEMKNHPEPMATLYSDSFDGKLNLNATQKRLEIDANAISLEKVMKFLDTSSALKSGNFDLDVELLSDNFLELNTSALKGDISLDATDLLLQGIDADKSIETLKNYQDISILDGNIPGMSIVSSIIEAPANIVSKKEIAKSKILQVHADSYIEDGKFYCYDCAVKTQKNRIAIKGAIDLNTTDFHYFEVGLLRDNGCAFFIQNIKGSVKKPDIALAKASLSLVTGTVKSVGNVLKDGVNFGTSLISKTGGLIGDGIDTTTGYIPIVNKATGAVSGTLTTLTDAPDSANHMLTTKCQPFYRGVVSHPLHQNLLHSDMLH